MSLFEKILATKIEETPAVPLPPVGTYVLQVSEPPRINDRANFTVVSFPVVGVAVMAESVDPDDFDETKAIEAQNQLQRFLREHLKITESEGESFKEALAVSRGRYFAGELSHRQDKNDSSVFYAQISKTMAAE